MDICHNRWWPDTCGCEVEYNWDRDVSIDDRVHNVVAVHTACSIHQGLPLQDHWNTVLEENMRKNKTIGKVFDLHPEFREGLKSRNREVSFNDMVKWHFDGGRVLHVELPTLAVEHKTVIQQHVNEMFGEGKVVVHQ